jgi:exopolyphosphatase/guanosine-5'-triphosphate,3'-diphosphate pyrophosphatase
MLRNSRVIPMDSSNFFQSLNNKQANQLRSAFSLAENCNYPQRHTWQVAHLSQRLFSELESLHKLGEQENFWLLSAAILHDIGIWSEGRPAHHKTALKIILNAQVIRYNDKERLMIGSIARYHRKSLPSNHHDHFSILSEQEKCKVSSLSAILRVADGLDVTHSARISDLKCKISKKKITIICNTNMTKPELEKQVALEKSDLMQNFFHKEVIINFRE